MTVQTDACDVARTRPMRHVAGRTAELRCGVCRMRDLMAGGPGRALAVAVAHVDADGRLCVHDRLRGAQKRRHAARHGDRPSALYERDDVNAIELAGARDRCGHRLRGTAAEVFAEMDRGRTTVFLDAA